MLYYVTVAEYYSVASPRDLTSGPGYATASHSHTPLESCDTDNDHIMSHSTRFIILVSLEVI